MGNIYYSLGLGAVIMDTQKRHYLELQSHICRLQLCRCEADPGLAVDYHEITPEVRLSEDIQPLVLVAWCDPGVIWHQPIKVSGDTLRAKDSN